MPAVHVLLHLDLMCATCRAAGARIELTQPVVLEPGEPTLIGVEIICGACGTNVIFGEVPASVSLEI